MRIGSYLFLKKRISFLGYKHVITYAILFCFNLLVSNVQGQDLSNYSTKQISGINDTILIDSNSIVPGSVFMLYKDGSFVDKENYIIDYAKAHLIWTCPKKDRIGTYKLGYRRLPFLFTAPVLSKSSSVLEPDLSGMSNPFIYSYKRKEENIFSTGSVSKSGSISRGISFGNGQDVIVNSNLDLRLSGKVNDEITILAAITDDNIPIQPDGNTQQIQEFDKVFIKLFNKQSSLTAGDFEIQPEEGYFMRFFKKVQGVQFSNTFNKKSDTLNSANPIYSRFSGSAALSKGKFGRNVFNGIEGNQGPYKLYGSENESYIIVISGTEKVYIDGKLLERGQDYDYTIDYNIAEISFTPNQLITKDKRIVVEFQYSDRNYARSILHAGGGHYGKRLRFHVNIYSEQDAKEQPIDQDLSQEQKQLLSNIGDNLDSAISTQIDSVGYSDVGVLYNKVDSMGLKVFQYSPDSGVFRVSFSFVGPGKGNYVRDLNTVANGRVFKWVGANLAGIPLGDYEPISLLVTPKKKQMVTLGGSFDVSQNTQAHLELAFSNNDLNTFSDKDREDDFGYALKLKLENKYLLNKSIMRPWVLHSQLFYEQREKSFSIIERYRSAEFERDWNIDRPPSIQDEYIPGLSIALKRDKIGFIKYDYNSFMRGSVYRGSKNSFNSNLRKNGTSFVFTGSLVQTETEINSSNFIRSKGVFSQQFKWLVVGVLEEQENNIRKNAGTDSLNALSYDFFEIGGFVKTADTLKNQFGFSYKQRSDFKPLNNSFKLASLGESLEFSYGFLKNPASRLKGKVVYRKLTIEDSSLIATKPDESLISRVEYRLRLWKGAVQSSTFYQIGSGMEVKKEFSYVRVAEGQGVYEWIDRDLNEVVTLDEFEIAAFQYNANYIRVNVPTNQYIKTYSTSFNESLFIRPAAYWKATSGVKNAIARFSNQSTYRIERKITGSSFDRAYNPFSSSNDSSLVTLNSSFRSVLFFNRTNPVFGIDLKILQSKGTSLMLNGIDSREQNLKSAYFRYNIGREITLNLNVVEGEKNNSSEFFTSRDYSIIFNEIGPRITYQPNTTYRIGLTYNYKNKQNRLFNFQLDSLGDTITQSGGEISVHNNFGVEMKQNILSKGTVLLRANFIEIEYRDEQGVDAVQNTSLGFEMLEGLQVGSNLTWSVSYQRTLKEHMQLSITYDGKASKEGPVVHRGGIQLRAFF